MGFFDDVLVLEPPWELLPAERLTVEGGPR